MKEIKLKKQNNNTLAETREESTKTSKLEQILSFLPFGIAGKPVVGVLRLHGVIGKVSATKTGLTLNSINKLVEKMFKLDRLKVVCLLINSPGGSPVQAELIAKRIIDLAKEKDITVYSFIEDVAASGGYWLACAGSKIFASRSSIIGSIGVIASGFGFHEAIGKMGIERRVYTQGKNKSVLDPFKPEKESDIELINKIQKDIHTHFIDTVKDRRRGKLTQSDEILFNGEFWSGQIALDYGLIDGINDLYSFIQDNFGSDAKIEYIEEQKSWFMKKLGVSSMSKEFAENFTNSMIETIETKINNKFDLF